MAHVRNPHRFARRSLISVFAAGALATAAGARAESAHTQTVDLALGGGSSVVTGALSWNHFYGFGESRRLKVGLGARFASFFGGSDREYKTADGTLIGQNQINTLTLSDARSSSLNLAFLIKYRPLKRLEAGFDIDLVGVGFGKSRTGNYRSDDPALAGPQPAEVSSFNLFRAGRFDRGQLDSEFFLAYWWSDKWGIRAGFSHVISEYTTVRPLDFGNDRYRHEVDLGFVALTYRP